MQNEEPVSDIPHPRDLFLAIRHWDAAEVERLLALGANPNWKDRRGEETALAYAACVGTADVVRVLLAYGATDNGQMPLEEAVSWNRSDGNPDTAAIARLLLDHGGDTVNLAGEQGHNALTQAAAAGDVLTVQLFLERGAGVHANDALLVALRENQQEAVEILRNAAS